MIHINSPRSLSKKPGKADFSVSSFVMYASPVFVQRKRSMAGKAKNRPGRADIFGVRRRLPCLLLKVEQFYPFLAEKEIRKNDDDNPRQRFVVSGEHDDSLLTFCSI
jgi:hypothetical protein